MSRRGSVEGVLASVARLAERGEPYALATVVRVERPASTRRGDRALVTRDGVVEGWVGGACSEPIVVREALRALGDGEARLVHIGPPGDGREVPDDVVSAVSACASEGTIEVLVEPHLPAPLLAVVGGSPAAAALAELAGVVGWRVAAGVEPDADAVVVAAMGQGDELGALAAALEGPASYVGLVASRRRAGAVVAALRERGVAEEAIARLHSPAGLDLGPSTQQEIAVAILAELVAWRHAGTRPAQEPAAPAEAVDPVCGMTVPVVAGTPTALHDGTRFSFCGAGCQARFTADPASYLGPGPSG